MSAYSQAANGFVVSDRVTLMLDMLDEDARMRVLNHAYKLARSIKCDPLESPKENTAALAVYANALTISRAFQKRQKQSREARQVGAANREIVVRTSHDNREIASEERREEEASPTPPTEEDSKEDNTPPSNPPAEVKRSGFKPPTVDEVAAYCAERKNGIDPQSFIDFYEARGWKYSRDLKIKDWKAAVRNWENRRKHEQSTVGRGYGITSKGYSGSTRTPTAGNFRSGTAEQRAEAETVL